MIDYKALTRCGDQNGFDVPGAETTVLALSVDDALTTLRMVRGLAVPAQTDVESIPWQEAMATVLEEGGGKTAVAVRAARLKAGMSQQRLADAIGAHKSHISEIERGKRPVGKVLARKLGEVLSINYRVFL